MWPKLLFLKVLWGESKKDVENVNVVLYKSLKRKKKGGKGFIFPFAWIYNEMRKLTNMDSFATLVVFDKFEDFTLHPIKNDGKQIWKKFFPLLNKWSNYLK